MTARARLLLAAAPLLAAGLLALGSRCTDAVHSIFLHVGIVHVDSGCASGMALGPSVTQFAGLIIIVLVGILGSSVAVRDALRSLFDRLGLRVSPILLPEPLPVTAGYVRHTTAGILCGAGSRDPPRG